MHSDSGTAFPCPWVSAWHKALARGGKVVSLGSLCPREKEDGAWPVLLSLHASYSEQKTVTVSKATNLLCNCLQGISPWRWSRDI